MCVNDIITCGAKASFFLDYLATSKINQSIHSVVLNSIKKRVTNVTLVLLEVKLQKCQECITMKIMI